MDQFQQRPFKLGEGRGASFDGGVITTRDAALLPFAGYSTMNNVKKWHPGIQKRRGMIPLHSDAPTPGASFDFVPDFDGDMRSIAVTWAAARDAVSGSLVDTTSSAAEGRALETSPGGTSIFMRSWLDFAGVTFPVGPLFGVTLTLYSNTTLFYSGNFTVVQSTKSFGSLVATDWPLFTGSNLAPASFMDTGGVELQPSVMTLNAAGVSYFDTIVRGSGQAQLMLMDYDYDYLNVPSNTVDSRYTFRTINYFNSTYWPKLTVTMAA